MPPLRRHILNIGGFRKVEHTVADSTHKHVRWLPLRAGRLRSDYTGAQWALADTRTHRIHRLNGLNIALCASLMPRVRILGRSGAQRAHNIFCTSFYFELVLPALDGISALREPTISTLSKYNFLHLVIFDTIYSQRQNIFNTYICVDPSFFPLQL